MLFVGKFFKSNDSVAWSLAQPLHLIYAHLFIYAQMIHIPLLSVILDLASQRTDQQNKN